MEGKRSNRLSLISSFLCVCCAIRQVMGKAASTCAHLFFPHEVGHHVVGDEYPGSGESEVIVGI